MGGGGGFFIVIIVLFGLMWLFMIRPQKRKQLERQQMLSRLGPGTRIVTAGGIYGTIVETDEDSLVLEISEDVEVRVARNAIATVLPDHEDAEELEESDYEEAVDEVAADPDGASAEPGRR